MGTPLGHRRKHARWGKKKQSEGEKGLEGRKKKKDDRKQNARQTEKEWRRVRTMYKPHQCSGSSVKSRQCIPVKRHRKSR